MRESKLERQLVSRIERIEGLVFKFTSPGNAGVPDRLILINGKTYFAELKAPGQKLRPIQKHQKRKIEEQGIKVYVVDSRESLEAMINEIRPT